MLAVCVTVVLGLLSVSGSQAAPLTCEDLLRPLELSSTLGKWVYIAESSDRPFWEQILYTLLHSAWIEVSVPVGTQNNILDIAQFHGFGIPYQNTFGFGCSRINSNFTLHDNSTWTSVSPIPVTEVLLTTCSECLLTLEKWGEDGKTYTSLTTENNEMVHVMLTEAQSFIQRSLRHMEGEHLYCSSQLVEDAGRSL
uniref:Apolipoprotein M n=1 Tax=Oncorhynchus mykiss TaxID=8022 RepID=A0A8C7RW46_ONCMY